MAWPALARLGVGRSWAEVRPDQGQGHAFGALVEDLRPPVSPVMFLSSLQQLVLDWVLRAHGKL